MATKLFLALERTRRGDVWRLVGQTDEASVIELWHTLYNSERGFVRVLVLDVEDKAQGEHVLRWRGES